QCERLAYGCGGHASAGDRRAAFGQWHYRAGRGTCLAKADAAWRYVKGGKRGPRNTAVTLQTQPGHRESTKHYIESGWRGGTHIYLEGAGVQETGPYLIFFQTTSSLFLRSISASTFPLSAR